MKAKQFNRSYKNKLSSGALLLLSFFMYLTVFAPAVSGGDLPEKPVTRVGDPTITSNGKDMTVNAGQHAKTWIDWQGGFNIGAQNSVNNIGPSAAAVILHNDVSGAISNIQGALNGNCNVFLLNPSGILFAPGAQVNVGGLVVSTMRMSMDDFMSGHYSFNGNDVAHMGSIVNAGTITAGGPAGVTLMGGAVRNEGVINANLGTVNLISGQEVTLNVNDDGSIQAVVNKAVLNNVYDKDNNKVAIGVENVGEINANGGQVYIEAEAVKDVFDTLIDQKGLVKAGSMVNRNGKIVLVSDSDGIVQNTGTLDASAVEAGAKGGEIKILGDKVGVGGSASINVSGDAGGGTVLIGGNRHGDGPERNSSLTAVTKGVIINADAGTYGEGGKVILWSDGSTYFAGNISAKGGAQSGNGGFVEVSGKDNLGFYGYVDATAPKGSAGTLLLDPTDLIISTGAGAGDLDADLPTILKDNMDGSVVSEGALEFINAHTPEAIKLEAKNSLTVHSMSDGVLDLSNCPSLIMRANYDLGTTGNFVMSDTSDTITVGGSITITGSAITAGNLISAGGGVTLTAIDNSSAWAITVNGITTGGGNLIVSHQLGASDKNATFRNNGTLSLGGGDIHIHTEGAVTINGNWSMGTGNVYLDGNGNGVASVTKLSGNIQMGGGDLEIKATGAIGSAGTPITTTGLTDFAASAGGDIYVTNTSTATQNINITTVDGSNGVTTTSGNINITNNPGDASYVTGITIGQNVTTGNGSIALSSADGISISAGTVQSTGGSISINANNDSGTLGAFAVSAGARVIGGGSGTSITVVDARGISIGAGSNGSETIANSSTGTIGLTSTGAGNNVSLADYAIGGGTGLVTITSAGEINGNGDTTADIQSSGSVTLNANGIGHTHSLAIGGTTTDDTLTIDDKGSNNVSIFETAERFNQITLTQESASSYVDIDLYGADYIDIHPNSGTIDLYQILTNTYNRNFTYASTDTANVEITAWNNRFNTGTGSANISVNGNITQVGEMTVGGTLTLTVSAGHTINLSTADNHIASLGAVTADNGFSLDNGDSAITLTGTIDTSGGNGDISINTGTAGIDTNDQIVKAGHGAITFTSDLIDLGTTPNTIITTGTVNLRPTTESRTIGIAGGLGDYNLTADEIKAIKAGTSGISIGVDGGTGAVDINDVAFNDNVTIYGGAMSLEKITATEKVVTLNSTGAITDGNGDTNNVTAATLNITAKGGVGSDDALETAVSNLSILNNDVVGSTSNVGIANTGTTLTLDGITNNDQGDLVVKTYAPVTVAGQALIVAGNVIATGSGNIMLTNEDGTGDITINEHVQILAETGNILIGPAWDLAAQSHGSGEETVVGTGILIQTGGSGQIELLGYKDVLLGNGVVDSDRLGSDLLIRTTGTGMVLIMAQTGDVDIARIETSSSNVVVSAGGNLTLYGAVEAGMEPLFETVHTPAISAGGAVFVYGGGNVTVDGAVNSSASSVTLYTADKLYINSNVSAFTTIDLDSAPIETTYLSGVMLVANGDITFHEDVILDTGASSVTSIAGNVIFESTIDGHQALTVNADNGTATFEASVGGTTASLAGLTVTAGTISAGTITTTGAADAPGGNVSLTSLSGDIEVGVITTDGGIASGNSEGQNAGSVILHSAHDISVSAISAQGSDASDADDTEGYHGGSGGAVTLTAVGDIDIQVGPIDTRGGDAKAAELEEVGADGGAGGAVTLIATNISAGSIRTTGGDSISASDISTTGGEGGAVTLTATKDISVGGIRTTGGSGTLCAGSVLPADGGDAGPITITAGGKTTLSGDLEAYGGEAAYDGGYYGYYGDGGAGGDITLNTDVVLAKNISISTCGGDGEIPGDSGSILFAPSKTINGAYRLELDAGSGAQAGNIDLCTVGNVTPLSGLTAYTTGGHSGNGVLTLYGNISTDGFVDFSDVPITILANNVTIETAASGTADAGTIDFGGTIDGHFDLELDASAYGTHDASNVALREAVGGSQPLRSLKVSTMSHETGDSSYVEIFGDVTTTDGMDFSEAPEVITASGIITLTNTGSGTIDLSGGDVDALGGLTINAGATDIKMGATDLAGMLDVNSTGTTTLVGDITDTGGNVDFRGARNVVLGADLTIDTSAGGYAIWFADSGSPGANTLSGDFDLTLKAGTGNVSIDNVDNIASLTVTDTNTIFYGNAVIIGDVDVTATNDVTDRDAAITVSSSGSLTSTAGHVAFDVENTGHVDEATADSTITIEGPVSAGGGISFTAGSKSKKTSTIDIEADVTTTGSSTITIGSENDVTIADTHDATVSSVNGAITITAGENISIGAGATGNVTTTGDGDIILQGEEAAITIGTYGEVDSGGGIYVGQYAEWPATVTIGGNGLLAVGDINVESQGSITTAASITIDSKIESITGSVFIDAVNDDYVSKHTGDPTATVYVNNNLIGDDVTVQARDTKNLSPTIYIDAELDNYRGGYEFNATLGTLNIGGGAGCVKAQDFINLSGGVIYLSTDLTATDNFIHVNNPLILTGDSVITATSGNVIFYSTVDGPHNLTVNSPLGTTTFEDAVGGDVALGGLTVTAGSISATSINTAGGDDVAGGQVSLTSLIGDIETTTITTDGGNGSADHDGQKAGSITLVSAGNIEVGDISAIGGDGNDVTDDGTAHAGGAGGPVSLTAHGDISVGSIDTRGGAGSVISNPSEGTVGADGGEAGPITITAGGKTTLSGNLMAYGGDAGYDDITESFYGDGGQGADVTLNTDVVLANDIDISTYGGDGEIPGDSGSILFAPSKTINGAYSLELDAGSGAQAGNIDLCTVGNVTPLSGLTANTTGGHRGNGVLTLYGNISTNSNHAGDGSVNFEYVSATVLANNVTIDTASASAVTAGYIEFGGTIDGNYDLVLDTGVNGSGHPGNVYLDGEIGGEQPLNSLKVDTKSDSCDCNGEVQIHADITTTRGMDFSEAPFVHIMNTATTTLTNTGSGTIDLSGGVNGDPVVVEGSLDIEAHATNVKLGPINLNDALTVNSTGTTTLLGNITTDTGKSDTASGNVDFRGATNVVLGADVEIDTSDARIGNIYFANSSAPGTNTLSGDFDLTLNAPHGDITIDNVDNLASLTVTDSITTAFYGNAVIIGDVNVTASNGDAETTGDSEISPEIDVEPGASLTSEAGSITLEVDNYPGLVENETSNASILIGGPVSAEGDIDLIVHNTAVDVWASGVSAEAESNALIRVWSTNGLPGGSVGFPAKEASGSLTTAVGDITLEVTNTTTGSVYGVAADGADANAVSYAAILAIGSPISAGGDVHFAVTKTNAGLGVNASGDGAQARGGAAIISGSSPITAGGEITFDVTNSNTDVIAGADAMAMAEAVILMYANPLAAGGQVAFTVTSTTGDADHPTANVGVVAEDAGAQAASDAALILLGSPVSAGAAISFDVTKNTYGTAGVSASGASATASAVAGIIAHFSPLTAESDIDLSVSDTATYVSAGTGATATADAEIATSGNPIIARGGLSLDAANGTVVGDILGEKATADAAISIGSGGPVSAVGNIEITADDGVTVDSSITTSGISTIAINANEDGDGTGDLTIAQSADATISTDTGNITLEGVNVELGIYSEGSIDHKGVVRSTGNGDIKITADGGDFIIAGTGSEVNSGGAITVDNPYDVIIGGSGMTAEDDITIYADRDIDINAPVNSTMAGDISMTAGRDILLADEVRTTNIGDITLDAGRYIDDTDTATEDEYVACDTLTMTAVDGIGLTSDINTEANTIIANTTGSGAASIDISNVNARATTLGAFYEGKDLGYNTVGEHASFTFSQSGGGGLTVQRVWTRDGDITIHSYGATGTPGIRVDFNTDHGGLGGIYGRDLVDHSIDADNEGDGDGRVVLTTDAGGMVLGSVLSDDTVDRLEGPGASGKAGISITADLGDITLDVVGNSKLVDVEITSFNGYIDELVETGRGQDQGIDITGNYVRMLSAIGIGKKYQLEIDAVTLDAETTSSSGDVYINEDNDVVLENVTTVDGNITIIAGGYIAVENISANGLGKDVNLTSTGTVAGHDDIVLNTVTATDDITVTAAGGNIYVGVVGDTRTNDITMTATLGSILELDNQFDYPGRTSRVADAATDITGNILTLTAAHDIGGSGEGDIETNVATLVAASTVSGNIYLTELDGAHNGIDLQSVTTHDGIITLITNGSTHESEKETYVEYVVSHYGVAGGDYDVSIIADTGDMTIGYVQSAHNIILTATGGSITEINRTPHPVEVNDGIKSLDTTGGTLTITAQDEIGGPADMLETQVAILNAHTDPGDIYITEADDIELHDVVADNGSITIIAGGQIKATSVVSNTDTDRNDISITSTGKGIEVGLVNAGTTYGDVTLNAQGGAITRDSSATPNVVADVLTATAAGPITLHTSVNSVIASATAVGDITLNEADDITLTNVTTTNGSIYITSGGPMTVTLVTAGGPGTDGDVTLTTTTGDIIMSGDITALNCTVTLNSAGNITDTTSPDTDISAAHLVISAPNGAVGAPGFNNQLDTDVDTLIASASGPIYILEKNEITLTSVETTAGSINIEAGGTITAGAVTANGGFLTLDSTGGDILGAPGGLLTAGSGGALRAGGVIGTIDSPVNVNIDGDLWVWAGSAQDEISVILNGSVNSSARTERVEIFEPSPPGLVLYNNHLMGGGNYGSGSSNGSILSWGYGYMVITEADMFINATYERALQPWGYKMLLPWALTEGAKIDKDFLSSVPAVIDVSQLNLPALQADLNNAANYYMIRSVK